MQTLLFIVMGLGALTAMVGALMLLVAAFRQHVLWGLAYLLVPFANLAFLIIHWAEARKGFLVGLAGLAMVVAPLFAMPEIRDGFLKAAQDRFAAAPAGSPSAPAVAVAEDLTAKIQVQRDRIEQIEGQFAELSGQLNQRYQALAATRKALVPGDASAVARFNEEAASYQQQTAAQRRMQQELNAAREALDGLLTERSRATADARPEGLPVVMYSTSRCPACVMAKQYFAQRGVNYETRDVEQSPAAMEEFRKLGGRGVPLILVGAKRVEGFDSRALDAML